MINETTEGYEVTLLKLRDGWMVSKSVDGDDQIGLQFDPADIAEGTGVREFHLSIRLLDGAEHEFGPYTMAGQLLTDVVPFLVREVKAGNLDLDEARNIADCYASYTEGISRGTAYDGTTYVQWDDCGFIEITDEDFDLLFPTPEVEWWTAEEYAQWLEQEKLLLQEVIGSRAWTNIDGWFVWTQEKVDETIALYEKTLEDIKNGALISMSVDGATGVMLAQEIPGEAAVSVENEVAFSINEDERAAIDEEDVVIAAEVEDITTIWIAKGRAEQWEKTLAPYAPFGVTYVYDPDTDDFKLYWNGKEVRGITDEVAQIWISEHAGISSYGEDAIELYAVYEDGELVGLRQATDWEQQSWTIIRQAVGAYGGYVVDIPPSEEAAKDIP